jgi:TonB family protein
MNAKEVCVVVLAVLLILSGGMSGGGADAQKPPPLNLEQIKQLLKIAPDAVIAGEIRDRGVTFAVKGATLDELKQIGAGPQTLETLKTLIPPNRPPTAVLRADKKNIKEGEAVSLEVEARDPDDDQLHYRWTASAGLIEGDGSKVKLNTSDVELTSNPLPVKVSVEVEDGRGGVESKSVEVTVERPNRMPTVEVKAEKTEAQKGETISLSAEANDPDGDKLDYRWTTTTGVIEGTGPKVKLNTSDAALNSNSTRVRVSVTVDDGKGGTATETVSVSLREPPPPPPEIFVPPIPTRRVQPVYPAIARAAGVLGRVVVEVTIDEAGNVTSAKAVQGPPVLHEAAVEAAKQWKFRPATRGGKPVADTQKVPFNFQ